MFIHYNNFASVNHLTSTNKYLMYTSHFITPPHQNQREAAFWLCVTSRKKLIHLPSSPSYCPGLLFVCLLSAVSSMISYHTLLHAHLHCGCHHSSTGHHHHCLPFIKFSVFQPLGHFINFIIILPTPHRIS